MWKPKFIDRAINRGFKEKNTERSTTLSCSAGNLALRRLYHRGWRPTIETDSGLRKEESALLKGEVRLGKHNADSGDLWPELSLKENILEELKYGRFSEGESVVELYGGKLMRKVGEVGVTIRGRREKIEACAEEICSICITNERGRCGKPRAPYHPISAEELLKLYSSLDLPN